MSATNPTLYTPADIPRLSAAHALTTTELTALAQRATAAKTTAYCPYSRFRVGAVFLTSDGQFFSGANVENASFPVGTCAERVALAKAVTEVVSGLGASDGGAAAGTAFKDWREGKGVGRADGGEGEGEGGGEGAGDGKRRFKALAVATDISPPASPCGMCRQFIREFCDLDLPVYMFDVNGDFHVVTLDQLLPMSFGPDALPRIG